MKVVDARDYGIFPDKTECQISNIKKMLSEHQNDVCFRFEAGQYHLYRENALKKPFAVSNSDQTDQLYIGIFLEHMSHVTLDGQGAEFIFHGDMTPLCISDCHDVKIERMVFDAIVPFSAEGIVLKTEPKAVEISLDKTIFPYHVQDGKLVFEREYKEEADVFGMMEFDAQTQKVCEHTGDIYQYEKAYQAAEDRVRLEGSFHALPQVGNILVLRSGRRVHPGALVQFCSHVTITDVTFYQAGGLGIVFQFNEDIEVLRTAFVPNRKRGRKILSSHDDGLHFSNNKGCIRVEQCAFKGLMDDPINVHGTAAAVIQRLEANKLLGAFCHHQSKGFERWAGKGDVIGFIRQSDRTCCAEAVVSEYKLLSADKFEISFEGAVPDAAAKGYALENLTYTPSFICKKNYFGSCRARGVLVTTPKPVRIEENTFESSGSAVVISGDVKDWYESGTCTDVEIRDNKFIRCCTSPYQFSDAVIHIEPSIDAKQAQIVHHHITITGNEFELAETGILYADHAADIVVEANDIWTENADFTELVTLKQCANVRVRSNDIKVNCSNV